MVDRDKKATVDLKVRMKEPLRAQIEFAALNRGISMNAEAVARLEDSFKAEDLLPQILDLAYGPQSSGLLLLLGLCIKNAVTTAAHLTGNPLERAENWFDDPWIYAQVEASVRAALESLRPDGDPTAPKAWTRVAAEGGESAADDRDIGRSTATIAINLIREGAQPHLEPVRHRLGDAIKQRTGTGNAR